MTGILAKIYIRSTARQASHSFYQSGHPQLHLPLHPPASLIENYYPVRVCVHMLIERIFQCKNLRKLEPFEGHFGAAASYLSILYVKRVMVNGIR